MNAREPQAWLVLTYKVPSEPTRLRATLWRRLRTLGAVYLQNAVAIMPHTPESERALRKLRRDILEMNGTATLIQGQCMSPDADIIELFQSARDSEFEEVLDKCEDFHEGIMKEYRAEHFTFGELEENEVELVKLKGWFEKVRARDTFGGSLREKAATAIEQCSHELEAYAAKVYEADGDQA